MFSKLALESPVLLFSLWGTIQIALIGVWSRRRTRNGARAVWFSFGAMPVLMGISVLVVTPRERLITICHELEDHVEKDDAAGIGRYLDGDFEAAGFDRETLIDHVEKVFSRYRIEDVRLRRFEVTFPQPHVGLAEFDATCRVESPDLLYERLRSRWRVTFRRRENQWRVLTVKTLPTPLSPIRDLRDLLR